MSRKKKEVIVETNEVKKAPAKKRVYKKKTSLDLSANTAKALDTPVKENYPVKAVSTGAVKTVDPFDKPERDLAIIGKVFVAIVILLFIIFGWVYNPGPHGNSVFLWDAVHPTTIADILGSVLFLGVCVFFTGVFAKPLDTFPKWFPFALFGAGALGVVLIFA